MAMTRSQFGKQVKPGLVKPMPMVPALPSKPARAVKPSFGKKLPTKSAKIRPMRGFSK